MQLDLADLRITPKELEHLTGLDISDTFMGRVYRPSVFRHRDRLFSFILTELLTFGLILIFCLPISLVVARGIGHMSGDANSTFWFLVMALGLSVAIALFWNGYMWMQNKSLKVLAHLLDEVDKHNEIIQAVHIIDELGTIKTSTVVLLDRDEVVHALTATRESLVCGLMTEKILRKHKLFIARRYELFTNIETNLARLQHLQVNSQANEYGQLLNEALRIGRSVHREMERFSSNDL
jgi:hypothetical protein